MTDARTERTLGREKVVKQAFPMRSTVSEQRLFPKVRSAQQLRQTLDVALSEIRAGLL
jgi:hypothetical protein